MSRHKKICSAGADHAGTSCNIRGLELHGTDHDDSSEITEQAASWL